MVREQKVEDVVVGGTQRQLASAVGTRREEERRFSVSVGRVDDRWGCVDHGGYGQWGSAVWRNADGMGLDGGVAGKERQAAAALFGAGSEAD